MTVFALLGAKALWLTYLWLASRDRRRPTCRDRKGYGESPGLATGLLLNLVGAVIWLFIPARQESLWKTVGPWGSVVKSDRAANEPPPRTSRRRPERGAGSAPPQRVAAGPPGPGRPPASGRPRPPSA